MNALSGWLTPVGKEVAPEAALDAIAAAYKGRPAEMASKSGPEAGLWAAVTDAPGGLCGQEQPWTAIVGDHHWSDPSLAEIASSQGAAAALRQAYRRYGSELLDRLHGAFALAIVDPAAQRTMLAIDRLGIHSLYYSSDYAPGLVFGTTAGLVKAHPGIDCSIPPQSVYDYLQAYVCRSPGTIYREQRKLLPAQVLIHEEGRTRTDTYWRMPFAPDLQRNEAALGQDLMEQMRAAVGRSLPQGDPKGVGAFLSGGLDSSTVAGLLNERTGDPATTFTIGFADSEYDEMRYADAATKRFGTRAKKYYLTAEDTLEMAPKVAAFYDEPFGNSSALPTYFCARQAQQEGFTCLLAGDGGDEIFAGNSRYVEQERFERYLALPAVLRGILELLVYGTPLVGQTPLWRKARGYIAKAKTPLPDRLEAYNFYQADRLTEVFEPDSLAEIDLEAPMRDMREAYAGTATNDKLHGMMQMDLKLALADNDLRKVTGMCELAGISVRFPFLDEELIDFAATIPPGILIKDSQLRSFFKGAFKDFLPREILEKKKHGFGMPFYEWTRDHPGLRELAYDSLRDLSRRHLLRGSFIDKVMTEHPKQEATEYDGLVWDLLMLELWLASH